MYFIDLIDPFILKYINLLFLLAKDKFEQTILFSLQELRRPGFRRETTDKRAHHNRQNNEDEMY